MGGKLNRWRLIALAILVLGGAWIWLNQVPPESDAFTVRGPAPAVGHPAPDFTLVGIDGQPHSLSDYRGKPVVLNFWATWCGPCRAEMPELEAAAQRFQGALVVLGVDQGEEPETVRAFLEELGITFPIVLDREQEVGTTYNVMGLPTTYFVDRDGVIQHLWTGEMNGAILAEGIQRIAP